MRTLAHRDRASGSPHERGGGRLEDRALQGVESGPRHL
jgi:hypothetical protein